MEDTIPGTGMVASRESGLDWLKTPWFFGKVWLLRRTRGGAKAATRALGPDAHDASACTLGMSSESNAHARGRTMRATI